MRLRRNWGLKGWSLVGGNEGLKERDDGIVVVDMAIEFVFGYSERVTHLLAAAATVLLLPYYPFLWALEKKKL